jgi:hypothetical protein
MLAMANPAKFITPDVIFTKEEHDKMLNKIA